MDLLHSKDPVRTDLHCTECGKNFVAQLDHSVDGNHIIECPYCAHEHCRVIEDGVVKDVRWSSRHQRVDVDGRCVWKHDSLPLKTSSASAFIRDRWLNKEDW